MNSNEIVNLIKSTPELRKEIASQLAEDILNEISDRIREEIERYAESDPALTRRGLLKAIGGVALLAGGIGIARGRMVIEDHQITVPDLNKEAVIVPKGARDGQIIVRQGNAWMLADPSLDKWAGQELTPRDVTRDFEKLTEATLDYFKAFRVFTPNFFKPKRQFNLYVEVPSDGIETEIVVMSGTGTSNDRVHYVKPGEIVWIESAGIKVEFSSTPNVTWNANKFIRLQRKHYTYDGEEVIDEEKYGGKSTDIENWRHLITLSETTHYVDNFKKDAKGHLKCDLISQANYHYWCKHEKGDEYIKLVVDAECFTYDSDVVAVYMKGMVFSVADILATLSE